MERTLTTIPAHFDGTTIQLDVPIVLRPNARLLVTILEPVETPSELIYEMMALLNHLWPLSGTMMKMPSMTTYEPGEDTLFARVLELPRPKSARSRTPKAH